MGADRDLKHLWPPFRSSFEAALSGLNAWLKTTEFAEWEAFMVEGYRSAAYQNELWRKGRFTKPIGKQYVVTQRDGFLRRSNHQSSCAADIAFRNGRKVVFTLSQEVWDKYGHFLRLRKLDWGGDWKSFIDRPHGEWPASDTASYVSARAWQKKEGL